MRIEEVIGQRIQELRKSGSGEKEMTQEELGERIGDYLEKPWSRQAVSAAEKGQRSFTAVELVAFSSVFAVPVQTLFWPAINVAAIDMPSGVTVNPNGLYRERVAESKDIASQFSADTLRDVIASFRKAAEEVHNLTEVVDRTSKSITEGYQDALALEAIGAVIWKTFTPGEEDS